MNPADQIREFKEQVALFQWVSAGLLAIVVLAVITVGYCQTRIWGLEQAVVQERAKGDIYASQCKGRANRLPKQTWQRSLDQSPVEQHYQVWLMLDVDKGRQRRRLSEDEFSIQGQPRTSLCPSHLFRTAGGPEYHEGEGTGPYLR